MAEGQAQWQFWNDRRGPRFPQRARSVSPRRDKKEQQRRKSCLSGLETGPARPLSKAVVGSCTGRHARRATRAFSSEVETGSRQENASNQESSEALPQTDEAC